MKTIKILVVVYILIPLALNAQHKYVGVKMCGACHRGDKKGMIFETWQKSKHAEAYKTLSSPKAAEIAKANGLKKSASESPECLECHSVDSDAKLISDGVQCESCHGPGSDYKNMTVMKEKAKAIAAGLSDFKDKASKEKVCKGCHNEKSPTFKDFKFDEMWAKIKHALPNG